MENLITVILPLHICDEESINLSQRAISSVDNLPLMIVGNKEVCDKCKETFKEKKNISYTINDGETDFCSQINLGAKTCKTEFFSILEYDDSYTQNWISAFKEYSAAHSDVMVFLPINELYEADKMVGFVNESVWAKDFSDELGFIDKEVLKIYYNFNLTGAIFRRKDFIEIGSLKPSIKLAFWYEFMMRAINNEKKLFIIPKVGYQHVIARKGSLFSTLLTEMSDEERDNCIQKAQKEYIYNKEIHSEKE